MRAHLALHVLEALQTSLKTLTALRALVTERAAMALHVPAALQARLAPRVLVAVRAILAQHALAALRTYFVAVQAHLIAVRATLALHASATLQAGAPGTDCMMKAAEWHRCVGGAPSPACASTW